jgi:hypothetical protein
LHGSDTDFIEVVQEISRIGNKTAIESEHAGIKPAATGKTVR